MKTVTGRIPVFYIIDMTTYRRWSRNRWGTVDSIPDLYISRKNAEYQTTKGKVALHNTYHPECKPAIMEGEIWL